MASIIVPGRSQNAGSLGAFIAPRTAPQRDATGQQIQALGQGISAAGAATAKLALDYNTKLDLAQSTRALNRFNDRAIPAVLQYRSLNGAAANPDSQQKALADLDEVRKRLTAGLRTDDQKTMFGLRMDQRMAEIRGQMTSHTLGEVEAFRRGESEQLRISSAASFADAIVTGRPEDGPVARTHRNTALDQVDIIAEIMGWGPERKKAERLNTLTAMHGAVIEGLVADDRADDALEYLEGVDAGEIDPQERGRMQSLVRRAALNDRATRLTFDVIEEVEKSLRTIQVGPETPGPPPEADADILLDRGLSIIDFWFQDGRISSAERDATRTRLREEAGIRRTRETGNALDTLLESEKWLMTPENLLKGPNQLPPELYEELARIGRLDDIISWHKAGRQRISDPVFLADVLDMTAPELREFSEGEFFLETHTNLAPAEQAQAMARYRSAFGRATEEDDSVVSQTDRIKESALGSGIIPDKPVAQWSDLQTTQFKRFNHAIQVGINEAKADNKPTKGTALQEIIDAVLLDVVSVPKGSGFFGGIVEIASLGLSGNRFGERGDAVPVALLTPVGDPRLFTDQQREDLEALQDVETFIVIPSQTEPVIVRPFADIRSDVYLLLERKLREEGIRPTVDRVAAEWLKRDKPENLDEVVNNPKASNVQEFLEMMRRRGR